MFETAELGHHIGKLVFAEREPVLRSELLVLQYRLLEKAEFPVLIVIGGVDGASKARR